MFTQNPPKSNHNHNERGGEVESRLFRPGSRPSPQKEIDNVPIKKRKGKDTLHFLFNTYRSVCSPLYTCFRFDAGRAEEIALSIYLNHPAAAPMSLRYVNKTMNVKMS